MDTSHIIQVDLEQIFALSDINWLFKFIYLHNYWLFGFAFALLSLIAIKKLKNIILHSLQPGLLSFSPLHLLKRILNLNF